jgi:hypothetical protein
MFSSVLMIALASTTLAAENVKLRTLDGQTLTGRVVRIEDRQIVLASGGQERSFLPAQLHSLIFQEGQANARSQVQVALLDGSVLQGKNFSATQGQGKLTFGDNKPQEFPMKSVAWVRLREQPGKLAEQWDEYLSEEAHADRLILRRKASSEGETAEASLDVMEGVVGDVSDATVNFTVDGDVIRVKRDRVDGIVYFRGREAALPAAACYVVDTQGSRWAVKTLALAENTLTLTTSAGIAIELPLSQVRQLDYAAGNLQYLSDLTPDRTTRESWLQSGEEASDTLFRPLAGHTPEGAASIGGTVFSQTVWMPAKSSLTLRVPTGFKRFRAQVGIDDRVSDTDGARLLIEGDGKVLFDHVVKREATPTPLDIDLAGARRVRITVDYGGESFLGDQLVLCEAVFTK